MKETKDFLIKSIKDYFISNGGKGAVIGCSGGKDSTVCLGLLVKALGSENVHAVLMPNGVQSDIDDSMKIVKLLNVPYSIVNIKDIYNAQLQSIESSGIKLSEQAKINVSPRLRMTTLYAISASLGYRVCGTGNASESFVGYTTKGGDNMCDFNPIANLLTDEVVSLGDELNLPYALVHKTPSDGLCGKSDEENMGCTYDEINTYIKNQTTGNKYIDKKIEEMHKHSEHKRNLPVVFTV